MLEYIITDPVQHESLYKKYAAKRYFRVSSRVFHHLVLPNLFSIIQCSKFMYDWCRERWTENADVNIAKDLPQLKADIRHYRAELEARRVNGEEDVVEEDPDTAV